MKVAILGGSGKTGRAVGAALAQVGVAPRPLGRAAFDDLPAALAGADAVHVIAPNLHPDEPAYVTTVLAAAREAGVGRLVYHSVASPYVPAMPHHLGKAMAEDVVRRSGLAWTILQSGAYLQNLDLTGPVGDPGKPADDTAVDFETADLAHVGRRYSKQFSMVNAATVRTRR